MAAYKPYALLQKQLEEEFKASGNKYIIAIDGRRLYVRSKKDVLNTYTQGNSAIIFKHWMIMIRDVRENYPVRVEQIIKQTQDAESTLSKIDEIIGPYTP